MRKFLFALVIALLGVAHATVPTETAKVEYTCPSSTPPPFAYTFKLLRAEDAKVVVSGGDLVTPVTLVLTTDYTVAGVGVNTGGTIQLAGGRCQATGRIVTITRRVPVTQTTNYRTQGSFYPGVHENSFDKLTMIAQQMLVDQDARDDAQDAAVAAANSVQDGNLTAFISTQDTRDDGQDSAIAALGAPPGGGVLPGIGGDAGDHKIFVRSLVVNLPQFFTAPGCTTASVAFPESLEGDACVVGGTVWTLSGEGFIGCFVDAPTTVSVRYCDMGVSYDPPSSTFIITLIR